MYSSVNLLLKLSPSGKGDGIWVLDADSTDQRQLTTSGYLKHGNPFRIPI